MGSVPSTDQPAPSGFVPEDLGAVLQVDEKLLWTGRPLLAGYASKLLWLYPGCFLAGTAGAVGAWFTSVSGDAVAPWDFGNPAYPAISGVFALAMLVLPLLGPLRLWRSSYALTTHRVIIREPALIVLGLRTRSLDASRVGNARLKCIWRSLADGTGDIVYGSGTPQIMERVPHAEDVVALIRRSLFPQESGVAGSSPTASAGAMVLAWLPFAAGLAGLGIFSDGSKWSAPGAGVALGWLVADALLSILLAATFLFQFARYGLLRLAIPVLPYWVVGVVRHSAAIVTGSWAGGWALGAAGAAAGAVAGVAAGWLLARWALPGLLGAWAPNPADEPERDG